MQISDSVDFGETIFRAIGWMDQLLENEGDKYRCEYATKIHAHDIARLMHKKIKCPNILEEHISMAEMLIVLLDEIQNELGRIIENDDGLSCYFTDICTCAEEEGYEQWGQ